MTSSESQKADQIAFHFYTKLFYVVNHARTTNPLPAKLDKWFNLETPDSELFSKEEREPYKSISLALPPPPLEIQVLLTIPELTHNQVLVHISPDSSRVRIHPTPRYVLLESYVLDFIPARAPADVPLPTIYKHGIPLFRSLFTLLRILPVWKLHKRLRRRAGGGPSLGITLRVRTGNDPDVLSLTIPHPLGSLALSTTYLTSPTFQLDELESLLSSRFLSLDNRPFTPTLAKNHLRSSTSSASVSPPHSPPRAIRTSASTSSGTSAPVDRQGPATPSSLPRSSLGTRPSQHQSRHSITSVTKASLAFTPARPSSSSGVGLTPLNIASTTPSGLSSTRAQVLRQEHQQDHLAASSSSLSPSNSFYTSNPTTTTSQDPPPARRPQYPFPFKSNTVSASSSPSSTSGTGLPSSFGTGPGIPSSLSDRIASYDRERVASLPLNPELALAHSSQSHSQSSQIQPSQSQSPQRGVPLPLSHVRQTSLSRRSSTRDSPDDPAGSSSVASGSTSGSARKRYSSSFGHRYAPSSSPAVASGTSPAPATSPLHGNGSGSASASGMGSGTGHSPISLGASPSPSSTSFQIRPPPSSPLFASLSGVRVRSDDEDISLFVQDIDTRKPLVGRARTPVSAPSGSGVGEDDLGSRSGSQRLRDIEREGSLGLGQTRDQEREEVEGRLVAPHAIPRPFPLSAMEQQASRQAVSDGLGAQSPPGGLMLTSEAEVDVRLRRMNEAFLRSLEGLGGSGSGDWERSRSQSHGGRGAGSSATGNRFSPARERSDSGSRDPWTGEPPGGIFIRQSSDEIIGRMELEGDGDGEDSKDKLPRRIGGGGGSGGRYLF
ncbi:hypothetical protein DXG03_008517 [Asterophora parasitica]|uniref:Autophagy-related protein 13 n=1 Tax=Asterophora parasitica TaxID=117018 RepID=A0A9P7GBZ2_9AGAR|nr:hypothetical protein DXG03_008517 [Asterophora parasitica]